MAISGLEKIVGKEIIRVVVKERDNAPRWQLYLLFSDNTYFEIYSNEQFTATKDVDRGGIEDVRRYMDGIVVLDAASSRDQEKLRLQPPITTMIQ